MDVLALIGRILAILAIMFVAIFALSEYIDSVEADVQKKIDACVASGGTPIVVGHQLTSEFKGCTP